MKRFYKKSSGFTLLEMLIVIAILAVMAVAAAQASLAQWNQRVAAAAGNQIQSIGDALSGFIAANDTSSLIGVVLAGSASTTVTLTNLTAANSCGTGIVCLPNMSATTTNSWNSPYTIKVRRLSVSPTSYEALVVTTNPWNWTDKSGASQSQLALLGLAAATVNSRWGQGGVSGQNFVNNDVITTGGTDIPIANYAGVITAAGQLAYYISPANTNNLNNTFLRVDGTNSMTANLAMGGHQLSNAASVQLTSGAGNNFTLQNNAGVLTYLNNGSTAVGAVDQTGNSTVTGNTTVAGNATVVGTSTLTGAVLAQNTLAVTGASTLTGAVAAQSTLAVTGASTLTGAVVAQNNLSVAGISTLTGAVGTGSTVTTAGNVVVNGSTLTLGGGGTGTIATTGIGSNLAVAAGSGVLDVTGAANSDVRIESLSGYNPAQTNVSVRAMLPPFVEMGSYLAVDGGTVPAPNCARGVSNSGALVSGNPGAFAILRDIPASLGTGGTANSVEPGVVITGPTGGLFTVNAYTDIRGAGIRFSAAGAGAVTVTVRTFCSYANAP